MEARRPDHHQQHPRPGPACWRRKPGQPLSFPSHFQFAKLSLGCFLLPSSQQGCKVGRDDCAHFTCRNWNYWARVWGSIADFSHGRCASEGRQRTHPRARDRQSQLEFQSKEAPCLVQGLPAGQLQTLPFTVQSVLSHISHPQCLSEGALHQAGGGCPREGTPPATKEEGLAPTGAAQDLASWESQSFVLEAHGRTGLGSGRAAWRTRGRCTRA